LFASLLALLAVLVAPAAAQEQNIVEIASESEDFNTLVAAVEAANLVDTLSGEGPFTVFAPTDQAFEEALAALDMTADDLLADTDTLTTILTYHVVDGAVFSGDLTEGDVTTLQGEPLTVSLADGVMINNATVTTPDIEASNGVIHVIDAVLLPPSMTDSMADGEMEATEEPMMEMTPEMEETEEAMMEGDMEPMAYVRVGHFSPDTPAVDIYVNGEVAVESLEYPNATDIIGLPPAEYEIAVAPADTSIDDAAIGPATVAFGEGTLTSVAAVGSLEDGTLAPAIFARNIEAQPAGTAEVTVLHAIEGAPAVNVVAGETPLITSLAFPGAAGDNDGYFTIDEVPTGTYDLSVTVAGDGTELLSLGETELADDTYYFVVAAGTPDDPSVQVFTATESDLGVAPGNLAEVATAAGDFETLLAAVEAAGLSETLATGGPFTVFAPTDQAFAEALDALGLTADELLADTDTLTTILQYHIVEGEVPAATVVGLEEATTLQGEAVSISVADGTVTLNDSATVIAVDVEASNGIIHVIDAVLLPPGMTESE
jgi:transforming growth factor-beta-induced protein